MKADKRKRRLRSYRTFTSEMERIIKLFLTKHQWSPEPVSYTHLLTLSAGSYYIALEGSEGKALSAPLLMSKAQPHATPYAWHLVGSNWEPAKAGGAPYLGHYWMDPIFLGKLKAGGTSAPESANEPRVMLVGERLYLSLIHI